MLEREVALPSLFRLQVPYLASPLLRRLLFAALSFSFFTALLAKTLAARRCQG